MFSPSFAALKVFKFVPTSFSQSFFFLLFSLELFRRTNLACFSREKWSVRERNCFGYKTSLFYLFAIRVSVRRYLWYSKMKKKEKKYWIWKEWAGKRTFIFRKKSITKSSRNMREKENTENFLKNLFGSIDTENEDSFLCGKIFCAGVVLQHETLSTVKRNINIFRSFFGILKKIRNHNLGKKFSRFLYILTLLERLQNPI